MKAVRMLKRIAGYTKAVSSLFFFFNSYGLLSFLFSFAFVTFVSFIKKITFFVRGIW